MNSSPERELGRGWVRAGSCERLAPDDCARILGLASGVAERSQPALTLPSPAQGAGEER